MRSSWIAVVCLTLATACIEDAPEETETDDASVEVDGATVEPDQGDELPPPDAGPGDEPDDAVEPPPPPACGNEDEMAPNHEAASAAPIEAGFAKDDLFLCPGTEDWFRVQLNAGQGVTIRLQADPEETDLDLAVIDPAGVVLIESAEEFGMEALEFEAPAGGEYFVRVSGFRDSASFYALVVESGCRMDANCPDGQACNPFRGRCAPSEPADCGGDDFEPNDRDADGAAIAAGDVIEAVVCGADRDWFLLELERGASVDLLVAVPGRQDLDVFVIDVDTGRRVAEAVGDARTNPERLSLSHVPAGRYAVGVFLFIPEGERDRDVAYRLEVAGRSGACEIDRDCGNDVLPVCDDGVCLAVDAPGEVMPGGRCGEDSDCGAGSEFCWTGGSGGHDNFCTRQCDGEGQCDEVGDGYCAPVGRGFAICVPACGSDDDCSGFRTCEAGVCEIRGECRTDRDCGDGEACQSTRFGRFCGLPAGDAECGDDGREPDSHQNVAVDIAADGETVDELNICNADDDWFRIEVPEEKAAWLLMVTVEFREGVDIDVYAYDVNGNVVGQAVSPDETTETIEIRFAVPGEYFVRVDQFSSDALRDTSYAITVDLVDNEDSCTVEGNECGGTEPLRTQCLESGACAALEGGGEVELGGRCDSDDDCVEAADVCWVFEGGDQGWNICTRGCEGEDDCADIEGTVCTRFQRFAACLPPRE